MEEEEDNTIIWDDQCVENIDDWIEENERQNRLKKKYGFIPHRISIGMHKSNIKSRHTWHKTTYKYNEDDLIEFLRIFDEKLGKGKARCSICNTNREFSGNKRFLEIGHIIPISKGGATNKANLMIICKACNMFLSNKTNEEITNCFRNIKKIYNLIEKEGNIK